MSTVLWQLASGILNTEFDNNTGVTTTGAISGWLYENLGRLNTYIFSDFAGYTATGANGAIDTEAQNILKELMHILLLLKQVPQILPDLLLVIRDQSSHT